ncbi:MAG: YcxB family protein [Synergistaceae bacterium]|nr:YcxB family protein [Synergistaceae bacterium]
MCLYRTSIEHNAKTIQALYKAQYYTYDKARIILRFSAGLAMIIICAASNLYLWLKGLLLLAGAWLVSVPDFPAQMRADKVLQARKNFPVMNYEFHDEFIIISGEGSMKISYPQIKNLVHDKEYYYMFIARDSVCMMQKSSLAPNEQENFTKFISLKTGQNWKQNKFFLAMNLTDIRELCKTLTKD